MQVKPGRRDISSSSKAKKFPRGEDFPPVVEDVVVAIFKF